MNDRDFFNECQQNLARAYEAGQRIAEMILTLICRRCGHELAYVHGHGACVNMDCSLKGVNQAECCSGECATGSTETELDTSPLSR